MSAPEVQVRVYPAPSDHLADACSWVCIECHGAGWSPTRADAERRAAKHESTCSAVQLSHLQARWDARDKAERALIEKWRAESGNWQVDRCADELERAMEGGRG